MSHGYHTGRETLTVLSRVKLEVRPGGYIARTGPSGAGKTTLLSILGGLETPTDGAAALNSIVDEHNSSTAQVAEREGAILVDLHAQREVPDMHPDWVSGAGFHPSTAGCAAIAGVFAATLKQATGAAG
ncbi:MAG: ATP-binding cassette domain-containing protein [Candidatus Dormibacteraceae bacterium]